jgi:hypothetical protein
VLEVVVELDADDRGHSPGASSTREVGGTTIRVSGRTPATTAATKTIGARRMAPSLWAGARDASTNLNRT